MNATEEDDYTALMFACQNGHDLCARALLEAKAAVDATDEAGWTALMYAAQNGHEQARSSQFEYVDSFKPLLRTHFHTYSSHHLDQVARALLENNADIEKPNNNG